ncbi:hypothetical protein [Streptomyces sp. NPDC056405]|uniref:hypothetical protein n=1 Tax=Streptomyces sp. NPDC056405 TaxID=3345811 RepID=UPI0035E05CA8
MLCFQRLDSVMPKTRTISTVSFSSLRLRGPPTQPHDNDDRHTCQIDRIGRLASDGPRPQPRSHLAPPPAPYSASLLDGQDDQARFRTPEIADAILPAP